VTRAATQYRQVPQDHHLMQEFQPLRVNSPLKKLIPVRLPSGRARLATRPLATGSAATKKTIGMVVVAALAANAAALLPVEITATRRRMRRWRAKVRLRGTPDMERTSLRGHATAPRNKCSKHGKPSQANRGPKKPGRPERLKGGVLFQSAQAKTAIDPTLQKNE
jgi:hypothetical protein